MIRGAPAGAPALPLGPGGKSTLFLDRPGALVVRAGANAR
jgi:hypothetical protein